MTAGERQLAVVRLAESEDGQLTVTEVAAKLGVPRIVAIDIDPIAAEIARRNCDANGIGSQVEVRVTNVIQTTTGRMIFAALSGDSPATAAADA